MSTLTMTPPRIVHLPSGVSSAGQEAVDLARLAGLVLDPWQAYVLEHSLTERPDGRWAAFEVGLNVARQNGKGPQSLDTAILTTDGWTNFADIRVGQQVFGSDGLPTMVVGKSAVYLDEDCFEVGFTDGSRYVVGADHLWSVFDKDRQSWRVVPTRELNGRASRLRTNGRMEHRYRVRCDAVPHLPDVELPIDPYLLGYWLGDGTSKASVVTVGHEDEEWVASRIEAAGATVTRRTTHDHGHARGLYFRIDAEMRDGFESRCRRLGVWGDKHIPDLYLRASASQRRALLAGLMDSDGSIAITNRSPQVELSSSYPRLAEGIFSLLRGLGIRVVHRMRSTARRMNARFMWTPSFNPFEMPRKAGRFRVPASRRHELMSITSVEAVASVPVRCIQVAATDGVYLTGRTFTPTHNSCLEARELAGLFLLGERLIIHSAHQFDTSLEAFRRLLFLIEDTPELSRRVKRVSRAHGEEGIELTNGQRVRFRTRTKGGGRGFSGDCVILDEAMILPEATLGALMPTLSARPNPQLWYAGSAVDQAIHMDGIVWARVRQRAMAGEDTSLAYFEWSADAEHPSQVTPEMAADPTTWRAANPAMDIRIEPDHIAKEMRSMDPRTFAVERLGVGDWPDTDPAKGSVIPLEHWRLLADPRSVARDPISFALDISPDRSSAAIAAAGIRPDGLVHVEVIEHRPGVGWLVDRVQELRARHPSTGVWCDAGGQTATIADQLRATATGTQDYVAACAHFFDLVGQSRLRHLGSAELESAIAGAARRSLVDAWAWSRRSSRADITPLVAATLAVWAASSGSRQSVYETRELLVL